MRTALTLSLFEYPYLDREYPRHNLNSHMRLINIKKWCSIGAIALAFVSLWSCKQDSPAGKEEPQVSQVDIVGTTVTIEPTRENTITHSGYQISLPKGVVEQKTEIKVKTATQKDFQHPTYKALSDGIELSGNIGSLLNKGCEISFNNPDIPDGTEMYVALVYSEDETELRAIGDKAKQRVRILTKAVKQGLRTTVTLQTDPITDLAIKKYIIRPLEIIGASKLNQMLVKHQMPNMEEFGLKEVVLPSSKGKIALKELSEVSREDKVLLFIHGWTSSPIACWNTFITNLHPLIKEAGYTKYLTLGYNTSMPIDKNGELLSLYLQNNLNGAKVDIVAHSMGGLVSRSALENYKKGNLVQNLITLGTPHKGSPMAIIKYGLEAFSSSILEEDGELDEYSRFVIKMYNDGSQGFQDLYTESDFIKGLANNEQPSTFYHPIAAIYSSKNLTRAGFWLSQSLQALMANADGVVTKESAWGIPESENNGRGTVFMLPGKMPHITLTESEEVIHHVSTILKARAAVKPEVGLPEGVVIDINGTLVKWPNEAIPQDGIIRIPNTVKVIGIEAFRNCENLKQVIFHSRVTTIERDAFYNCSALSSINLPNSIQRIGANAFSNCTNLKEVTLPSGTLSEISDGLFGGCISLSKINLPKGLKSIGRGAFNYCTSLRDINIPEGVTKIGGSAFSHVQGSITLPSTVKELGVGESSIFTWPFFTSEDITIGRTVYLKAVTPPSIYYGYVNNRDQKSVLGTFRILYVPRGSKQKYLEADIYGLGYDNVEEYDFD